MSLSVFGERFVRRCLIGQQVVRKCDYPYICLNRNYLIAYPITSGDSNTCLNSFYANLISRSRRPVR